MLLYLFLVQSDGSVEAEFTCKGDDMQSLKLADASYKESNYGLSEKMSEQYRSGIPQDKEIELVNEKGSKNIPLSGQNGQTYIVIFRKTSEQATVEIKTKT